MKLRVINEDHWKNAASDGGTFQNLGQAFYWRSCEDWPCPFAEACDTDKEYNYNGWLTYYETFCGPATDPAIGSNIKLPPEVREYIGIMYVHWKMVDSDAPDNS